MLCALLGIRPVGSSRRKKKKPVLSKRYPPRHAKRRNRQLLRAPCSPSCSLSPLVVFFLPPGLRWLDARTSSSRALLELSSRQSPESYLASLPIRQGLSRTIYRGACCLPTAQAILHRSRRKFHHQLFASPPPKGGRSAKRSSLRPEPPPHCEPPPPAAPDFPSTRDAPATARQHRRRAATEGPR